MEASELLVHKYRNDRRKLIEFLLSSNRITQLQSPSNIDINSSDAELDSVCVDYVLNRINSGQVLDLEEARNKYIDQSKYPVTIESSSGSYYFVCSDPGLSGSPPRRAPPKVDDEMGSSSYVYPSNQMDPLDTNASMNSEDDCACRYTNETDEVQDANFLSFGLPIPSTGLSEDDLRETAYELLLFSIIISGFQICSFENKKKENKSRFLSRLKSKRENLTSQPQETESHLELLNVIRSQMQISEAMDARSRQRVTQLSSTTTCAQIEIPYISLELLNGTGRYDFPSGRLYTEWKKRQANVLEEFLYYSSNLMTDEHIRIRNFIAMIRNNEQWDTRISTSEQAKILLAIKKFSLKLSSMPGMCGIPGETYYWTSAYHLNINLYEKLLSSIFDILEEGQLVKETDEILVVIKMTWPTLGIYQTLHDIVHGWVFFQKFVETGETKLLDNATLAIQKVQSSDDDEKQEAYMNCLICSRHITDRTVRLNFMNAVFVSISIWCEKKINDYHQHFSQKVTNFEKVLTLFILVGMVSADESGDIKLIKFNARSGTANKHLKACIENSIQATCVRLSQAMRMFKPRSGQEYPMARLADEMIMVVEKESTVFCPVLSRWCPEAGIISSMQLQKFYGERLKPILDGVTCLSEELISVLSAADMLDRKLTQLYYSARSEDKMNSAFNKDFDHYQIGEVCKPIILDWLSLQHVHILEWTERAINLEDWESLSFRQKHAASIVEVFRILEEMVDQLFNLKLPLDVTHLQSLVSVIFQSLETYLLKMATQLVEKNHMFPAAPGLTRYKETTVIPTIKKKSISCTILEENIVNQLNSLTVSKLCVRLNTLQYIQSKLSTFEEGIKESWALVRPCVDERREKSKFSGSLQDGSSKFSESVSDLFITFNKIAKAADEAMDKIYDFIGTRAVFWDLKDSFLFTLYRGKIENARLECSLPHFDSVLDQICTIITDPVRDSVVQSICRAAMECYIWVLLEGGPSRAFQDTDNQLMQEDLQMLKDFFVADGEGLPPEVVEQEAMLAQYTIHLYSLQSETLIEMLLIASEKACPSSEYRNPGGVCIDDAHTLLRVLCHKKDRVASKFLKMQYQLPDSSEYEDTSTGSSPLLSDLLKRSKSSQWAKRSQRSFRSMTKRLQEATSEIRLGGL